jgi:hypothetical protein
MTLTTLFGDVGSGKTLLAVILALFDDRPVYANFWIDSPRYIALEPEMLATLGDEPCLVIIDEAYVWLESRTSTREVNRYMSYILFQSRKRQITFILTAQLLSSLDVRFRSMTSVYVYCQRTKMGFNYTMIFPGHKHRKRYRMAYIGASRFFEKYKTMAPVDAFDKDMVYNVTRDKSKLLPELDRIIDKMLKEAPADKWTKGVIADYCMEENHPFIFQEMIYNRIKRRCLDVEKEEAKPETDRQRKRGDSRPKGRKKATG